MVTHIDWNQYPSDGVAGKYTGTPSTQLQSYIVNLLALLNKDPAIINTFGRAGVAFTTLPQHYTLETRLRTKPATKPSDDYVHGHPKKVFRTVKAFADHVASLLLRNLPACACESCRPTPKASSNAAASSSALQPGNATAPSSASHPIAAPVSNVANPLPMMASPSAQPSANPGFDQDGTPNVIDQLMHQAKQGQPMNEAIAEPHSMHWLLEKEVANLPAYLKSVESSKRWTARLGEIVLVARNVKEGQAIKFDEKAGVYKIEDAHLGAVGIPLWEAAVVTQIGKKGVTTNLLDQDSSTQDINGFRVEPVSEAGNTNKAWSTRYKQVDSYNIRSFSLWQELLKGVDINDPLEFHPTIRNALAAMSSMSLVDRYHFTSNGHEARVYCKGIYIGAEFITKNDVVRFTSPIHNNSFGKDVLLIKHIYMSHNLDRDPALGSIHIEGVAFTQDPQHSSGEFQRPIPDESLPNPFMRHYGLWYKMSDNNAMVRAPYTSLLTRLVEGVYTKAIIGKPGLAKVARGGGAQGLGMVDHIIDITYGIEGVRAAREYSQQYDFRIKRGEGQTWYVGEDRVDQLDLQQVNDQDVGHNARFGFESNPTPLEESHLKAMFRARAARQKGPKVGASYASVDFLSPEEREFMRETMNNAQDAIDQGLDKFSNRMAMEAFESGFTQRTEEADFDEFLR